jgi:hypothetical protein
VNYEPSVCLPNPVASVSGSVCCATRLGTSCIRDGLKHGGGKHFRPSVRLSREWVGREMSIAAQQVCGLWMHD